MKALIGLDYVLEQLNIMTPYGGECLKSLRAFRIEEAKTLLQVIGDLERVIGSLRDYALFYNRIEREFCRLKDIRGSIKRCRSLETLDEIQLFEIKLFSIGAQFIKNHFEAIGINITGVNFRDLEPIIAILDPEGHRMATFSIYDAYSQELREVRERKRFVEGELYRATEVPRITELKEERLCWVVEEEALEKRILAQLSSSLLSYMEHLEEACTSIGVLDFTIAKAKLAIEKGCNKPLFQEGFKLQMLQGRHPYVEELLHSQGKVFTPIDITLKPGTNAITGPNMGGKSITLKTIALNAALAHLGFYVFAEALILSLCDFQYLLANDYEAVSNGLSSFGGEIIQLNEYLEATKVSRGLLLIDEFARGTNPSEGRLLVKSLMSYLNKKETISLFVTHFDGVVGAGSNHYQVVGLKNVDFDKLTDTISYDPQYGLTTLQSLMDYRLEAVEQQQEVPKDALRISALLGLDKEVVEIAKLYYSQEV